MTFQLMFWKEAPSPLGYSVLESKDQAVTVNTTVKYEKSFGYGPLAWTVSSQSWVAAPTLPGAPSTHGPRAKTRSAQQTPSAHSAPLYHPSGLSGLNTVFIHDIN